MLDYELMLQVDEIALALSADLIQHRPLPDIPLFTAAFVALAHERDWLGYEDPEATMVSCPLLRMLCRNFLEALCTHYKI